MIRELGRNGRNRTTRVDIEVVGPRTSLVLRRASGPFGRIDFAYYPFGPERRLDKLLDLARAKFDVGAHPMGLAARLLLVHDVRELPNMIRRVQIEDLIEFFNGKAQELVRKKPQ